LISHDKKIIFIHIPKTGGTSVSRVLGRHGIMLHGVKNHDSLYFKHALASDVRRMMGDQFDRYYSFTIVRNPWDWVVSNYEFNRGLHRPFTAGTRYRVSGVVPDNLKAQSFKDWLQWWIEELQPSQHRLISSADGQPLVKKIYRFEDIGQCLRDIRRRVHRWALKPIPHAMRLKGKKKHYSEYYDAETMKLVEEFFAVDIERFGYSFKD
jgi:hypothetical protein